MTGSPSRRSKTEGDAVAAHRSADFSEGVVRAERLEPDDDARDAEAERVVSAIGGRHSGVQPERNANAVSSATKCGCDTGPAFVPERSS